MSVPSCLHWLEFRGHKGGIEPHSELGGKRQAKRCHLEIEGELFTRWSEPVRALGAQLKGAEGQHKPKAGQKEVGL